MKQQTYETTRKAVIIAAISVIAVLSLSIVATQSTALFVGDIAKQEPIPRPEKEPMSERGSVALSLSDAKVRNSMNWVNQAKFLSANYQIKEIRSNDLVGSGSEVVIVYGDNTMDKSRYTFEDNYHDGIIVVYFEDGEAVDWTNLVKILTAKDPVNHSYTNIDGVIVYKEKADEKNDEPARAYYRDGTHTIVAISSGVSVDELEKIVRSAI